MTIVCFYMKKGIFQKNGRLKCQFLIIFPNYVKLTCYEKLYRAMFKRFLMGDSLSLFAFIGLGNPGREYELTRHNIGFLAIDQLSRAWDIPVNKYRFKSLVGKGNYEGNTVLLAKPQGYMNLSGDAVASITRFYKLSLEQICIIHDDLDLPFGKIRLRRSGGSAGQKGMASIIARLGTEEFYRLRIGIGRPPGQMEAADYVLQSFRKKESGILEDVLNKAVGAIEMLLNEGIDRAMTFYNHSDSNDD
jgi:PTH1 family peptidyl-tRNA hydrolase